MWCKYDVDVNGANMCLDGESHKSQPGDVMLRHSDDWNGELKKKCFYIKLLSLDTESLGNREVQYMLKGYSSVR